MLQVRVHHGDIARLARQHALDAGARKAAPADAADAAKITANNVRIVADMSSYSQEGTYQVPVTVYIDGYDSAGAIGQYSIAVNLSAAEAAE